MIHCGTHASVTTPPKIPALGFSKKKKASDNWKVNRFHGDDGKFYFSSGSPQSIEQKNAGDIMEVFRLKTQLSGEAGLGWNPRRTKTVNGTQIT